jgi:putative NADH-flavin reductase
MTTMTTNQSTAATAHETKHIYIYITALINQAKRYLDVSGGGGSQLNLSQFELINFPLFKQDFLNRLLYIIKTLQTQRNGK